MLDQLTLLLKPIIAGSSPAITAILLILLAVIGWFAYERDKHYRETFAALADKFQKQIEGDRKDLLGIIEKYQQGQISVIQAINEIRVLIATISGKL
jgi:uncharacterized protein YbgA (DUF1722 family)